MDDARQVMYFDLQSLNVYMHLQAVLLIVDAADVIPALVLEEVMR